MRQIDGKFLTSNLRLETCCSRIRELRQMELHRAIGIFNVRGFIQYMLKPTQLSLQRPFLLIRRLGFGIRPYYVIYKEFKKK